MTVAARCTLPPAGWTCRRGAGHAGPCAASPPKPPDAKEEALRRLLDVGQMMSNLCHALKQNGEIDAQLRQDAKSLQESWDVAKAEWREVSRANGG